MSPKSPDRNVFSSCMKEDFVLKYKNFYSNSFRMKTWRIVASSYPCRRVGATQRRYPLLNFSIKSYYSLSEFQNNFNSKFYFTNSLRLQLSVRSKAFPSRQLCKTVAVGDTDTGEECLPVEMKSTQNYAVIGSGLAGVATCWHLVQESRKQGIPVKIYNFSANDVGEGASGAAAGLLHFLNPRGKILWAGLEGFNATLNLINEAEKYSDEEFCWRDGILRYASEEKEIHNFDAFVGARQASGSDSSEHATFCVTEEEMQRLVPGMRTFSLLRSSEEKQSVVTGGGGAPPSSSSHPSDDPLNPPPALQQQQQQQAEEQPSTTSGVHIPNALVIDPTRYLKALWRATERAAEAASAESPGGGGGSSSVELHRQKISSLTDLPPPPQSGDRKGVEGYDAVVVAGGAASPCISEVSSVLTPLLRLSRGQILDLAPSATPPTPATPPISSSSTSSTSSQQHNGHQGPSLLGPTYFGSHQQGRRLLVGSTNEWNIPPEQALGSVVAGCEERERAEAELLPRARAVLPMVQDWTVSQVLTGVRAYPPKTNEGALPIVGRLPQDDNKTDGKIWVHVGLGARGLVYHAWVAECLAKAIVLGNEEEHIPSELRQWKTRRVGKRPQHRKNQEEKRRRKREEGRKQHEENIRKAQERMLQMNHVVEE